MTKLSWRGLGALAVLASGLGAAASAQDRAINCPSVQAVQGGGAICQTAPGADVFLDGSKVTEATSSGWAFVGFPRGAPRDVVITSSAADTGVRLTLAPQDYPSTRIESVPRAGAEYSPKDLAHICISSHLKKAAFSTPSVGEFFLEGFILPAEGRRSGVFGSQRIYNNQNRNPRTHWGIDVAAPTGTPVLSPAGGVVRLADPNLFFEGGAIFLDHGQGLVSVMMHLSEVNVAPGDVVAQGQRLGAIGSTGRSTGPHLHWGIKYQDKYWIDPAQLMALSESGISGSFSRDVSPAIQREASDTAISTYKGALMACFDQ